MSLVVFIFVLVLFLKAEENESEDEYENETEGLVPARCLRFLVRSFPGERCLKVVKTLITRSRKIFWARPPSARFLGVAGSVFFKFSNFVTITITC